MHFRFRNISFPNYFRINCLTIHFSCSFATIALIHDFFDTFDKDGNDTLNKKEFDFAVQQATMDCISAIKADEITARVNALNVHELDLKNFIDIVSSGAIKLFLNGNNEESRMKKQNVNRQSKMLDILLKAWSPQNAVLMHVFKSRNKQSAHHMVRGLYWQISFRAKALVANILFKIVMSIAIVSAAVLVGVETQFSLTSSKRIPAVAIANNVILFLFCVEIVAKIVGEGEQPMRYFADSWNCFDVVVVLLSAIFAFPGSYEHGSFISAFRILRVVKLVKSSRGLRTVFESVIGSLRSSFFAIIIVFLCMFMFAITGILLFQSNDPEHFGSLKLALISLFRVATLDGWSDIM